MTDDTDAALVEFGNRALQRLRQVGCDFDARHEPALRRLAVDDEVLTLVVRAGRDFHRRKLPLSDIGQAVVQVEFSPPTERELELTGARSDEEEWRQ